MHAKSRLNLIPYDLGGSGEYRLLYFLVRVFRPKTVLETGVGAGFSSAAILSALRLNAYGSLYSSDFPYFRVPRPERFVGWVVPDELREGWDLRVRGDRSNLRSFARELSSIDLFHYDSDKSYSGREFALRQLACLFHGETILIFDDIQDNLHFRDFVRRESRPFKVFEFGGKWLGVTGGLLSRAARSVSLLSLMALAGG